ncbi:MAG: SPL family radical SAM protein [Elusimicrobiales bacterium]
MRSDEILLNVRAFIEKNYPFLGVNKKREIERLLFEILKSGRILSFSQLPEYKNYEHFKKSLLKIRYPNSYGIYPMNSFFLGGIEFDERSIWRENESSVKEIFIEKSVDDINLVDRLKKEYPLASFIEIDSIKEYIKKHKYDFSYSDRKKKIYVVNERYDFVKKCPCTKNCVSCGYNVINLGFGCPFDCEYCYLSGYQNIDGIIINANVEDYLRALVDFSRGRRIRVGSGEFTDSLVYDNITHHSVKIIDFICRFPHIIFEFKTKSSNLDLIINKKPAENIVVSFSVNPSRIIEMFEHGTAGYDKRIEKMKELSKVGWRLGVHFDPIIMIDGWRELYCKCIDELFDVVSPADIIWISAGTLRFYPHTKKEIEKRFPQSSLLDAEMIIDFDGKLRYPRHIRREMYNVIIEKIKSKGFDIERFYLCMEDASMWRDLGLKARFGW